MSCSIHSFGLVSLHIPVGHIPLLEKLGELDLAVFALRCYLLDRVVVGGESSGQLC